MKHYNKILLGVGICAATLSFGACTGDLDLLPTDPNDVTPATFAEAPDEYMNAVFANIMLNFVDQGPNGDNTLSGIVNDGSFAVFQRALFNVEEIPTDEACWLWYQNDGDVGTVPFGIVSPNLAMAYAPYYRFVVNASLCNDFLESCNAGYFDGANTANMAKYKVMARTLREICMYYLLDLYGNVPWIDDNTPVGSVPTQYTAAEIYAKLTAEMEETLKSYDTDYTSTPVYGYFGKDCCEAYLMKLYLNAEVYCGTPNWAKAYEHAKAIIDRHKGEGFQGSGLCMNYNQVFGHGNQRFAPGGGDVNEILWTLPGSYNNITSWGCATLMVSGYLNNYSGLESTDFATRYNTADYWNCILGRKQLAEAFDWDDDNMGVSSDTRVRFWLTSADGFSFGEPLVASSCPNNGYPTVKYSNWYILDDGSIDEDQSGGLINSLFSTDYAMVRLAEVYLSAAEAILHGAGSASEALIYTNYIRERAGLDAWTSVSLETLRGERQRELYSECIRRTDLRRYGTWISGYNWDYKGSASNYAGQDFPSNFNLYPLPSTVCSMAGYTQNPGY